MVNLKKPEVDSSQPLDVKQEGGNGVPPTNKRVDNNDREINGDKL